MANHLAVEKQFLILSLLCEGQSIRATSRIADVSPVTVLKLLLDAGQRARDIHDTMMVNIRSAFIECDEQWGFIFKKQKRVSFDEAPAIGDFYTFIAMDSDTKLVPSYLVGKRTGATALVFMKDLATRVTSRFQLSTDSYRAYADVVDHVYGADVDYGQIHKEYAELTGERRYSPGRIIRATKKVIIGNPIQKRICTSYIERQNLTVRMQQRRFTRLTNGFSKSLKHHEAAVDLHFFYYNFVRIHQTLRVTPAMEAKITNRLWSWKDLLLSGSEAIAA
jgi:IS1 family transposase